MAAGKVAAFALNQAPRLAVNIAGKLKGLLGPKMYSKMGGLRGLQQVGQEALYSGGASAGFTAAGQLMSGEGLDIPEILAYGLADTATGGLAVGGVRALRGTKGLKKGIVRDKSGKTKEVITTPKELVRSRGEIPANVVASIATPMAVSSALQPSQQQEGNQSQVQQIDQQQLQRMLVNDGLLAGQYMPGTMLQQLNTPGRAGLAEQFYNSQGPGIDLTGMEADMARIVGL
jgi:hypothetical protein